MAFNASFTVSQGSNVNEFTLTDNSTGSDGNITSRNVSLYKVDGTLLGGAVINWPLPLATPLTISLLDRDYSLNIIYSVVSSAPLAPPSEYTFQEIDTFLGHTNLFLYELNQQVAAQPNLQNDDDFQGNMAKLYNERDNAVQSQAYDDQGNSEAAILRAKYLMDNANLFF